MKPIYSFNGSISEQHRTKTLKYSKGPKHNNKKNPIFTSPSTNLKNPFDQTTKGRYLYWISRRDY